MSTPELCPKVPLGGPGGPELYLDGVYEQELKKIAAQAGSTPQALLTLGMPRLLDYLQSIVPELASQRAVGQARDRRELRERKSWPPPGARATTKRKAAAGR